MGPVQDISWNIHRMSSHHVKYALYDVLFLKHFLFNIYSFANKNTPHLYNSYLLINPITRFMFLNKKLLIEIISDMKKDIDPIHNYHLKINNSNNTLISLYNTVINDFFIDKWQFHFSKIMNVNYYRLYISILFKRMIYNIFVNNYKIYKSKQELFQDQLSIEKYFNIIKDYKMFNLLEIFLEDCYKSLENKIFKLYRK